MPKRTPVNVRLPNQISGHNSHRTVRRAAAVRILHTLTQNFLNFGRFAPNQHLFPDFRRLLPGDFLFPPNILSQLSHIHMVIWSLKHSFYTINVHYGVYVCYKGRAQQMVPWSCGWFEGVTPTDRRKQIPPHTHTTGSLKTNTHRPTVRERERVWLGRGGRRGDCILNHPLHICLHQYSI